MAKATKDAKGRRLPQAPSARLYDPRVALAQVVLAAACGFCLNKPASGLLAAACIAVSFLYLRRPSIAIGLLAWAAAVNLVCQGILLVPHWGGFGAFVVVFFVLRKAVPIAGAALLFVNALTVSRLIAVLTRWRCPKPFVLTLAIAYRFMPTVAGEASCIRDALAMRGRPLALSSFVRAPKEMLECVLVPLMMRCTRIADELAASATTRAIENPARRTSRIELAMRGRDWAALALTVGAVALVACVELA